MPLVKVADAEAIPVGQGTLVEEGGIAVAVFNGGAGRFYACGPICPHENGPLAEGWLEGEAIVCPWHGFDFDLRTGRCLVDEELAIPVYPVHMSGESIEVELP